MGTINAKKGDRSYSLEELGITTSTDVYGEERMTIVLPPNELFGTGQAQATLNPSTGRWELGFTGNTKFGQKIEGKFKRKNALPDHIEPPSRSVKWTEVLPQTDHVQRFLDDIDWQSTSLGPLETWPNTLQAYLNIVFADSQAAVLYWGEDLVAVYNEPFIRLVSGRLAKPQDLFGVPFVQIWPELWDDFEPMLRSIAQRGSGLETLEVNLFPYINDIPEETFWQGSFLPIQDGTGTVQGFYNRAREITKTVINERRARVVSAISAKPNLIGDFVFQHLMNSLALSERDFPLAFVYSAQEDSKLGKCRLKLQCGIGLPENGHALVPSELELYEGHAGFIPYLRKAKSKDAALVIHQNDGTLPEQLVDGFNWKGFGETSRSLAFLPLSTSDRLLGMLVVGLNPRRPFDEEYEGFLNTLLRSISATVGSAIDREEARNRAERLAKQLEDSEKSIREIAEYGPVGIARISPSGKLVWANDQYYEITGHGRDEEDHYELSFLDIVVPEDKDTFMNLWLTLSREHRATSTALRVQKTWEPPSSPDIAENERYQHVWVLASGYPIMDHNDIKAYAVSISDISRFKWAEQVQSQSAAAAKEAKRLQENFIDIISHEMRNPLSAIAQLADAISGSMDDFKSTRRNEEDARETLEANVENAKTILLCAAHQKRIIDDVLTLSKLDSMLLSITPVIVQPYQIVEGVLRMFEAEFSANDIAIDCRKTESYNQQNVDWVCLDPSRLTQIFINLITNAIKFTRLEVKRRIDIRVGAIDQRPPSLAGVVWFPTNKKYKDLTLGLEWGDGDPIYVCFEVQDTGRGLEQTEMNRLFERFQQATEKTHVKYGGSGLGLFISRELTETQGGEIGVRSKRGEGTTFAFYVKGRRAEAPNDPAVVISHQVSAESPKHQGLVADQQRAMERTEDNIAEKAMFVLLCEDNVVNSKVLKKQLEKANCEVHVANHGMEALDFLHKTKAWEDMTDQTQAIDFDVVLMDVEMPIMDGLTCTRRIRQLEAEGKLRKHTNIIAITANARKEQIDTVIQAGADDVLPKPFLVKDCLEKIRQILSKDLKNAKRSSD